MTFKVNLDLEFLWSITEDGELKVELCSKNRPEDVKAEFTFDKGTIVEGLDEDLEELSTGYAQDVDLDEWLRLSDRLSDLAATIRRKIEDIEP